MCEQCNVLEKALKVVQNAAKTQQECFIKRLSDARQQGYKEAGSDWKHAVEYGKQQEQLRLDENAVFTKEIMELEEEIERLKDVICKKLKNVQNAEQIKT